VLGSDDTGSYAPCLRNCRLSPLSPTSTYRQEQKSLEVGLALRSVVDHELDVREERLLINKIVITELLVPVRR